MNGTLMRPRPPSSNVAALRKHHCSPFYPGNIRLSSHPHSSLGWPTSLTTLGCYWLSASAAFDSLSFIINIY